MRSRELNGSLQVQNILIQAQRTISFESLGLGSGLVLGLVLGFREYPVECALPKAVPQKVRVRVSV